MGHHLVSVVWFELNQIIMALCRISDVIKQLSIWQIVSPQKFMPPSGNPSGDIIFLWETIRHIKVDNCIRFFNEILECPAYGHGQLTFWKVEKPNSISLTFDTHYTLELPLRYLENISLMKITFLTCFPLLKCYGVGDLKNLYYPMSWKFNIINTD